MSHREREIERETDRQTDRQTVRQTKRESCDPVTSSPGQVYELRIYFFGLFRKHFNNRKMLNFKGGDGNGSFRTGGDFTALLMMAQIMCAPLKF